MVVRVTSQYGVVKYQSSDSENPYYPVLDTGGWARWQPGYGPGTLFGRESTASIIPCSNGALTAEYSLGRLTFTAPNGSETELRDTNTDGKPYAVPNYCTTNASNWDAGRGVVFASKDGSAMVFVLDTAVNDFDSSYGVRVFTVSGYLHFADGTTYRIDNSNVSFIRDQNGNQITFWYNSNNQVTQILDQNGRTTTVSYAGNSCAGSPQSWCDVITYPGATGPRNIEVGSDYLTGPGVLRSGYSPQTIVQLFPEMWPNQPSQPGPFAPTEYSYVRFPDNSAFQLQYDSYGEIARVVLPTGGAIEYDWIGFDSPGDGFWGNSTDSGPVMIDRVVAARREYSDGRNLSSAKSFSYSYAGGSDSPTQTTTEMAQDAQGRTLQQIINNWQQAGPVAWCNSGGGVYSCSAGNGAGVPENNPRLSSVVTTLNDTGQVSQTAYGYDQFNNETDRYEYDYGAGAPGALLRHTATNYHAEGPYLDPNVNLVRLPFETRVLDGSSGQQVAYTLRLYDEVDADHSLSDTPGIAQHDGAYNTGYNIRAATLPPCGAPRMG